MKIDISKLNKAVILASLYNSAKPQGACALMAKGADMSKADAEKVLATNPLTFDYRNGRVMKVDLSGDELDTTLYDQNNGEGAAFNALKHLLTIEQGGPL